jgi:hypothetical protein
MKYPGSDINRVEQEVAAYIATIDGLFGLYLDCAQGFLANYNQLIRGQAETTKHLPPGTDVDSLDMFLVWGDPNDPNNVMQHRTTQGEFKRRNARNGSNYVRTAHWLIVLVFEYWETEHRARIASALRLKKDEFKIPLFGDIRRLRNDIIHNQGNVSEETVKKCEVMAGFSSGTALCLRIEDVKQFITQVKCALDTVVVEAGGPDPKHRTIWHVA